MNGVCLSAFRYQGDKDAASLLIFRRPVGFFFYYFFFLVILLVISLTYPPEKHLIHNSVAALFAQFKLDPTVLEPL